VGFLQGESDQPIPQHQRYKNFQVLPGMSGRSILGIIGSQPNLPRSASIAKAFSI
jgi:hypothetical protein